MRPAKFQEGKQVAVCSLMAACYGRLPTEAFRSLIRGWIIRMEGGPSQSLTIRQLLRKFYRIEIGLYSCWPYRLNPAVLHPGTRIGRYAWLADTVRTFTRNHPVNTKSTHAFFYNPQLGLSKTHLLQKADLDIGHGVWLGHNAFVLPPTRRVGDGAVVTAGSVVCSDIPPYSIASGFPARVVGERFTRDRVRRLSESRWWESSAEAESAGALANESPLGELNN
jgi:acetyltransferase-like isoleucine patch superfamily enzyme